MTRQRRCAVFGDNGRCTNDVNGQGWLCDTHHAQRAGPDAYRTPVRAQQRWHTEPVVHGRTLPAIIDIAGNYPPMYFNKSYNLTEATR